MNPGDELENINEGQGQTKGDCGEFETFDQSHHKCITTGASEIQQRINRENIAKGDWPFLKGLKPKNNSKTSKASSAERFK